MLLRKTNTKKLRRLDKLILKLYKNRYSLNYGIPLELQEEGGYKKILKEEEKEIKVDMDKYKPKSLDCTSRDITPDLCYFDVNHGLSIFDKNNKVLFDAGGKRKPTYLSELESLLTGSPCSSCKFTIIISHMHYDHYSFMTKIIEKFGGQIKLILLPERTYKSVKVQEMIDLIRSKGITYMSLGNSTHDING